MYVNTVDGACEEGPTLGQGIYVKMLHLQGGKIYISHKAPLYTGNKTCHIFTYCRNRAVPSSEHLRSDYWIPL